MLTDIREIVNCFMENKNENSDIYLKIHCFPVR